MIYTEIQWSAIDIDDPLQPIVDNHTTLLRGLWGAIPDHAELAAAELARDYFDGGYVWHMHYGSADHVAIIVEITSPKEVAGKFDVKLTRSIKAVARRSSTP